MGFSLTEPSIVPTLLTLGAAALIRAVEVQPRGWIARDAPIVVRPSAIANAGRGVFTTAPLRKGVVLGAYPGRLRKRQEFLAKVERHPATR